MDRGAQFARDRIELRGGTNDKDRILAFEEEFLEHGVHSAMLVQLGARWESPRFRTGEPPPAGTFAANAERLPPLAGTYRVVGRTGRPIWTA